MRQRWSHFVTDPSDKVGERTLVSGERRLSVQVIVLIEFFSPLLKYYIQVLECDAYTFDDFSQVFGSF